jgi:glycosyltransferase involved in cell wall biosynthesis
VPARNGNLELNLILSYGDLSRAGGYRARVLGELKALDCQDHLDPFLLVFDRDPQSFESGFSMDVPHRSFHRSAVWQFYPAVARLAAHKSIRLVHAHNLYSAALALSARWRYGYRVVLDYHGRIPEEYVYLGKGGETARRGLELLERWCVKSSDQVVTVSHKLAEYVEQRYKIPTEKISVIPCCADESTFSWDADRREHMRRSLNVSGKVVCAHVGSFFEWYDPDMIVSTFQRIQNHVDAYLLVITTEVERAAAYLGSHLRPDTFLVRYAAHEDVPALLNASDIGFLFLKPSPNIKTSSPAKFAEYLNCGLPTLITPDVGDYSEFVARTGVGAIVEHKGLLDASILDRLIRDRDQLASQCTIAGRSLTWRAMSVAWSKITSNTRK